MNDREGDEVTAHVPTGNDRLPEGWEKTRLGDLVSPSKDKVEPSQCPGAPYLGLEHVEGGTNRIFGHGVGSDVKSTKSVFHPGDVLYGKLRPYLNKVCMPAFDGICSTDFLVFNPAEWLDNRFVMHFLSRSETVEFANHHSSGIELPRVGWKDLAKLDLLLPPLAEQKRIVAKVESLLSRASAARERLAKVPALVQRFRQSVLAAACSGQLTADWREAHPDTESANQLNSCITVKRRNHWNAEQAVRERKRRYPEPLPHESYDLPPIPENWLWTSADALCSQITDGEHIQPRYQPTGRPMLTAKHVRDGYVVFDNAGLISEQDFQSCLQRCAPVKNDILIVSVGATTGRAAIVGDCEPFAIVRSVLLLKPLIDPRFFLRWCQSPWCFEWMQDASGASAQPHLYIKDTRRMPVPLPSLDEQQEIVRQVESLFRLADAVRQRVKAASARAEHISQSVLAKAFRGELVEPEAELARREGRDYEPASVLLERIRAARAVSTSPVEANVGRPPKARKEASVTAEIPLANEQETSPDDESADEERLREQTARPAPETSVVQGPRRSGSGDSRPLRPRTRNQSQPVPVAESDRNEVMAVIRDVFSNGPELQRDDAIREIAYQLGYNRVGSRIHQALDDDIRTAVRRGILENSLYSLSLLCRSINDYQRDHLIDMLLAAMGTTWWPRDDAIRAAARHPGYRRAGTKIQAAFQSAIRTALRRGLLERDGEYLRKVR